MSKIGFLIVGLAALLTLSSCSSSEDNVAPANPLRFDVQYKNTLYTGTKTYGWDTTLTVARMTYHAHNFNAGSCNVQIYDAKGRDIWSELYWYWNNVWIIGGGDYLSIVFTDNGVAAGRWTIVVDFYQFTGELEITLD